MLKFCDVEGPAKKNCCAEILIQQIIQYGMSKICILPKFKKRENLSVFWGGNLAVSFGGGVTKTLSEHLVRTPLPDQFSPERINPPSAEIYFKYFKIFQCGKNPDMTIRKVCDFSIHARMNIASCGRWCR